MKQIPVSLSELYNRRLPLGRVGENVHVQIVFQCSAIFSEFPNASTTLIVTAPGGESYAPEIEKDGTNILWTVTKSDLAKDGGGELQLTFKNGNEEIKSYIGKTQIFRSLAENGEVPTPIENWIAKAEETVRQMAQEAAEATVEDLADTKEACIEEIEQAGEDTRASIPSDYSKLSNDVTSLKSAIEEKADIKDSTKAGVDLDISDPSGNVLMRLADGHIQTKNFNSAEKQSDATILTVKSSGGDYTSIRAAVEAAAIAGASAENPYIIQIAPGTYDILSEYTSEEIAEEGFVGLMITNGITLEGMGMLRDDTVLYAEMDTTVYDTTKRNDVSTLNFRGSVGLKNLTVKSKNMRYGIHDDFSYSSDKPKIRRLENCVIYAEATTSWNIGNVSYGAGTDGNKIFIFDDCDLGDTVLIHTDVGQYSNMVIMHHCRCFQFIAKDYASTAVNRYYLYGCDFKWIRQNHVGDTWTSQHLFMIGDIKGAWVEGYSGMQYELGDSYRVQQSPVSTYPRAVTSATTGRYHIQTTSSADSVTGILYYYDSTEGYSLVQTGGWICAELLGFATPTVGQYLVVGSSGVLSLSDSDSNSIGRVVFANENGSHFIKLSI